MTPRATDGVLPKSDYIRVPLFCSGLLAGLVYILIEFGCALVYAGAGHLLGQGSVSLRRQRWLDGVSGSAMVGLAGWLALAKRQT
ncbi:hypothetical protein SAMN05421509_102347 [Chromohalobacter canadensis]|uniref:LysE type translocator n=1 Tax=Chromohalobacter canadensis TaxID=141389 RepID=A0A285VLG1_9GAMM|nr:hypothetical protein [Chromohalobacter canadensis]SOC53421.1 hypothetical protein SAMN05421509_102347 [Chromohalobacter canadensis]